MLNEKFTYSSFFFLPSSLFSFCCWFVLVFFPFFSSFHSACCSFFAFFFCSFRVSLFLFLLFVAGLFLFFSFFFFPFCIFLCPFRWCRVVMLKTVVYGNWVRSESLKKLGWHGHQIIHTNDVFSKAYTYTDSSTYTCRIIMAQ